MYGSVASVKQLTGVTHDDLGLDSEAELSTALTAWLTEVSDLIDKDRGGAFSPVPAGITHIANQMAGNVVALAMQRRRDPVVRIDDFSVRASSAEVLTEPIRRALRRYPRNDGPFRIYRTRNEEEIEENPVEEGS